MDKKKEELQEKKNKLNRWEAELNDEIRRLKQHKDRKQIDFLLWIFNLDLFSGIYNQRLKQQNSLYRKIQNLGSIFNNRGIEAAWEHYEKNKDIFRYPVYVPYFHSNLFSQNIYRILHTFIFQFLCRIQKTLFF